MRRAKQPNSQQVVADVSFSGQASDAVEEIRALKRKLQEMRRKATLMNADLERLTESDEALRARLDTVEAKLATARTQVSASRTRRKEMARVIANRDAKIAALNERLGTMERQLANSNPFSLATRSLSRTTRRVRSLLGRNPGREMDRSR